MCAEPAHLPKPGLAEPAGLNVGLGLTGGSPASLALPPCRPGDFSTGPDSLRPPPCTTGSGLAGGDRPSRWWALLPPKERRTAVRAAAVVGPAAAAAALAVAAAASSSAMLMLAASSAERYFSCGRTLAFQCEALQVRAVLIIYRIIRAAAK
jgi:hypothetical protein